MVRAPGAPEALQFSVRGSGTVAFGSYPQAPKEGIRPLHESSTAPKDGSAPGDNMGEGASQ